VWPHRVGALATAKKDAARANRDARLRDDLRGTMRQRNHCERKSMRRIGREGMLQDEEAEINRARLTSEPLEIRFVIVLDRLVDLCGHAFVAADLGGQQFSFEPYDYGPFDRAVYSELEALAQKGLVAIEVTPGASRRKFSLTPAGYDGGRAAFAQLGARAQDYLMRVSAWVRSLSFAELVGSIYKQYPSMKANSVFRG